MNQNIYKTLCRPVLFYGIENLVLSELEKKKLQIIFILDKMRDIEKETKPAVNIEEIEKN